MVKTSVKRPVAVTMIYVAVAALGLASWRNIPIELLPDANLPSLTISARWPGSSPEVVEAFLTSPLEAAAQRSEGVEKVVSTSMEGYARITIEFNRDVDMDFVRLDLSERLATIESTQLPAGVRNVRLEQYVPQEFQDQANRSILSYVFSGPWTLESMREHLQENVVPLITRIDGVGVVQVSGGRDRLLEVTLDPDEMANLGISTAQVALAVADLDLVREAGTLRANDLEWTLTVRNRPQAARDVLEMVVSRAGDRVVRLKDVGFVRDTYEQSRSYTRYNGFPSVLLSVYKEAGANTVRVADMVKAEIDRAEAEGPQGTEFLLDRDESEDIRRQLTNLRSRALISVAVVFLVLLFFLRSLRSALVIFATIAFAVLIALNLVYFAGISLNLLTLVGLAMGFGLVVDNSIVVLENIYRRWQEEGESRETAAVSGARRVILPVIAATATTLIVLVPFVYLEDELRVFYVPLAIVVALTLLASLFVAFSFIPSLVSRVLPAASVASREGGARRPFYERFYRGLVTRAIRYPGVAITICMALFAASYHVFDTYVSRNVIWGGGFGGRSYISITVELPRGSDLSRTNEITADIEERLKHLPEIRSFETVVNEYYQRGGLRSVGRITVDFPDSLLETNVPVKIKDQMYAYSLGFTGVTIQVRGFGPSFYAGASSPPTYNIQVFGYNFETVREIAEGIGQKLKTFPRISEVNTNASASGWFSVTENAPEFVLTIDRDRLGQYDLTMAELVRQIGAAAAGQVSMTTIKIGGDELRYDVKLDGSDEVTVRELMETIILTRDAKRLRLFDLARIEERPVMSTITREDQQYERTIAYEFRGPRRLGDVYHETAIEGTETPPGYTVAARDRFGFFGSDDRRQVYILMVLAVLLIYMVTSALFGSLMQPLCVLLTVPMALIGVFLVFWAADASFTREAYVGAIMMGGIVVNNAILLVDHINRIRRRGTHSLRDAIVKGTMERSRPILMTATTTVVGLLPLVLFSGYADANIWNALALALIGGLSSSTFLVLTVTPALYYVFERGRLARA